MNNISNNIEPHVKLIAALAETMTNNMWAIDIENRCYQISEAIREILAITAIRHAGER